MINGELIRKRRKELKMSQGELARGITSQGMISQIETQTATPSAKTLEKIITRLHLDFAETVKTKEYVNCEEVLTDAGISLINRQYTQATEMLKSLGKKLTHEQTMWREFMLAWLAARQGAQRSDTIFTYNRILQEDDSLGILWPITASELAIEYLLDDWLEAAAYYAQAAMEHTEGFVPRRSGSTSAYLVILTNTAYFYRKSQNYQSACKLAQEGIDLSRQKYIIGLIDKLYINLAYALAGTERRWNGEAIKALHMAYAFASHINNQEICQEAETELRKQGWLQYS